MWLLAATAVLFALGPALLAAPARAAVALAALALTALPFAAGAALWLDLRDFPPSPAPLLDTRRLASGLEINVPTNSPACWGAPLPCTPRVHPGLRLRRPPDLGAGFEADPSLGPPIEPKLGG
jgi:hypothetical protein